MERQEYLAHVSELLDTARVTVEKKSADYGNDFNPFGGFASSNIIGVGTHKSILTRAIEKLVRVNNLFERKNEVKDETIEDSMLDIVGYMAILYAYNKSLKKKNGK